MIRGGLVLGVATKTGSAVVVALTGRASAPRFAGRWDVSLGAAGLPAQPYHVAAGLDLRAAEVLVDRVERAAEDAAVTALRSAAGNSSDGVLGVAVVVKAVSIPAGVAEILRSHAWMHAAEGVLYREAVLGAARRCGWAAHAVDVTALLPAEEDIAALGRSAGRPWRRIEKDATRAGLSLLARA